MLSAALSGDAVGASRVSALLRVNSVARQYEAREGLFGRPGLVRAVDNVSLELARGETLGIVGESGCGKSTVGRVMLGIEQPDEGGVFFDSKPMPQRGTVEWRESRKRMQLIYQDPLGALDRRLSAFAQIREPLDVHDLGDTAGRQKRVAELLDWVGLSADHGARYPHELSGGQRQRIVLARALATAPDLIVCDEPVSALDVSIQAQVVNLLEDIQQRLGLAMIFISHDLKVVRQVSRRIAVMYLGRIVEEGDAETLFADPIHPYTQALVSAAPVPGQKARQRIVLNGEPPNPAARPSGCAFHPRCPSAIPSCGQAIPDLLEAAPGRRVACHLAIGVRAAA